jgi:hypothetical protein
MAKTYSCDNEYCAVKKLASKKDQQKLLPFFKPERPAAWDKDTKQWLDTDNIEHVMKQYEDAYPHFAFLGAVPLDFDTTIPEWGQCVSEEMCKLNLTRSLQQGKTDLGVVFNLDPHDKPGSHWVAAYVNIPKKSAYYYDSYGYKPEEVASFNDHRHVLVLRDAAEAHKLRAEMATLKASIAEKDKATKQAIADKKVATVTKVLKPGSSAEQSEKVASDRSKAIMKQVKSTKNLGDKAALIARIDTAIEGEYYRHGGILPYVLRQILK